ncbi:MAG: DUF721 domain-containing protein [Saprospiraceae bacterium]|nr:DUF721 domain-containing protein [Saprospiraceae bacterium]
MKVHLNIVPKKDKPIADVIQDLMSSNKKMGRGFLQKRLKVVWKELMGQNIHSYTKSVYLSKGTLFINITSSPLRQELSMSTTKIKDLINEKFGREVVEKVVVR